MNVLYRKLVRDIHHMAGQVLATSLVVACGVASFVAMRSTYTSLKLSQETYYARYRFADVFAGLKRAPESIRPQIESIPGVSAVQTRVIAEVAMDLQPAGDCSSGEFFDVAHILPSVDCD